ncbi:unnamed protein product [Didymodactylos carnosus]|uniref:Pentapeptide repeat-containing protein n=1 Tax=Didymodactylos carnosus TaxID=1234261 RepID=A0A8S2TQ34_9BILA|nr:unnamed protein product [Didymodactylos carnosus]CAF4302342.1 unnamed protein product [Didymodactylos carnosus]
MSFFRLFKKQKYASPTAEISTEDKDKREARRFNWTNVALGALIPLSIGIGTVVITLMQQKVDSQRQKQERELDDRRYNAERNEDDRRYNLEQDQADELYRQGLYKSTVEDISGALLKSNHTFLDDKTRLSYVSSKILLALNELDSAQKTRLFMFLQKNKLLPKTNERQSSLDLSGANFVNITITSTFYSETAFFYLLLSAVDLTNSSIIRCSFYDTTEFSDSLMTGVNFSYSDFGSDDEEEERTVFSRSNLKGADFSRSSLTRVHFIEVNLVNASFKGAEFDIVDFDGTNLEICGFY